MTTPENTTPEGQETLKRIDAVLEALTDFRESQLAFNEMVVERFTKIDERFDQTDERLAKIDERFDQTDERLARIDERFDQTDERLARIDERFDQTDERLARIDERFDQTDERLAKIDGRLDRSDERSDKMEQHLGYLRGAHAANVARQNASLIADDMGYQIITLLPREELIGFAKMAHDKGKPNDDVRSFREADLVMLVRDYSGQPAYVAVEASFTVANMDIRRAKRNADYLTEFTGLPSRGAVAGVDIARGRETERGLRWSLLLSNPGPRSGI